MTYYSDLGQALLAMDNSEDNIRIRRRGPREATFHETFEQDGDTEYVDARAKYMASDVQIEEAVATVPELDYHFDNRAYQLEQAEVSQLKEVAKDPSNQPGYFDDYADTSQQYDRYNERNTYLTDMEADVPVGTGNGAEILMDNLNKAANEAQVMLDKVQSQLAPIGVTAMAQAPGIIKTVQGADLLSVGAFSALAWAVAPSFIPGAKYLPLAIMAVWLTGQKKTI